MANEIIKRDQNHVTVLAGVTDDSNQDVTMLRIDPVTKRLLVSATGSGSGSVTTVSVVTANGFAGTVATATTTPAITITTTITGILQGNGTAISAATTTGSGSTVVLNGSPTLITPSIAAITVSGGTLTLPTGASDTLVSRNSTDTLTNKNLTSGTNTFPTFNQNTTGTSGGLTGTPSITVATVTTTGNIELGNASDTTISRVSAGVVAVEGVTIPTISSTNTLTNKRLTRRLTTTNAPGATPTTNTDNVDVMNFTGLAVAITSMSTNLSGTPSEGDLLEFRFTDNGTARAITWGASFSATTVALPTTTVASTMLRVGFERTGSTWACIAIA